MACRHLEADLFARQQQMTPGLLTMLQFKSSAAYALCDRLRSDLEATQDTGRFRQMHMRLVGDLLECMEALMRGDGVIDMREHGLTSDEELDMCIIQVRENHLEVGLRRVFLWQACNLENWIIFRYLEPKV